MARKRMGKWLFLVLRSVELALCAWVVSHDPKRRKPGATTNVRKLFGQTD